MTLDKALQLAEEALNERWHRLPVGKDRHEINIALHKIGKLREVTRR